MINPIFGPDFWWYWREEPKGMIIRRFFPPNATGSSGIPKWCIPPKWISFNREDDDQLVDLGIALAVLIVGG